MELKCNSLTISITTLTLYWHCFGEPSGASLRDILWRHSTSSAKVARRVAVASHRTHFTFDFNRASRDVLVPRRPQHPQTHFIYLSRNKLPALLLKSFNRIKTFKILVGRNKLTLVGIIDKINYFVFWFQLYRCHIIY